MGIIDWVISHQAPLFAIMLGVPAVYYFFNPTNLGMSACSSSRSRWKYSTLLSDHPRGTWLFWVVLSVIIGFSNVTFIPPTVGLETPAVHIISGDAKKGLIVFIHGWNGDSKKTWKRFPDLFKSDKRYLGFGVQSFDYPTYMLRRNLTITQLADWIERDIRKAASEVGTSRIVIVAHSMGGLIAREVVLLRILDGRLPSPAVLIEIGTPHSGADPAKLASVLGISRDLTAAMKANSNYLTDLRVRWGRASGRPPTVCFSSPQDKVVPQSSAFDQCDDFQSYPQWGHSEMVKPQNELDPRYVRPTDELMMHF